MCVCIYFLTQLNMTKYHKWARTNFKKMKNWAPQVVVALPVDPLRSIGIPAWSEGKSPCVGLCLAKIGRFCSMEILSCGRSILDLSILQLITFSSVMYT